VIFERIGGPEARRARLFKEISTSAHQTLSWTLISIRHGGFGHDAPLRFGGGVINDCVHLPHPASSPARMSSIYIASALVFWLHKGERPDIGGSQVTVQNTTTARV